MEEKILSNIENLHNEKYRIYEGVCSFCNEKVIENFIREYSIDVNYNEGEFVDIVVGRHTQGEERKGCALLSLRSAV